MIEDDLTVRSALRAFDRPAGDAAARRALVAARAGTGKTALLVQVAIDALLRGLPVLHVSIGETLAHVKRWYAGVYRDLVAAVPGEAADAAWEKAERLRLLMNFRPAAFAAERFVERVGLLDAEGVFAPRVVLVDGLRLEPALRGTAETLGNLAAGRGLDLWLAARTPHDGDELEAASGAVADLFDTIVLLEPRADAVALRVVRGAPARAPSLRLDPGTMLLSREPERTA